MKVKVKWNANEVEALADAVAKLRIEDPAENLTKLIQKAQANIFPVARQRVISYYPQAGEEFLKLLKRSLKEIHHPLNVAASTEPQRRPEPIIDYLPADVTEVLLNCSTTELINELTARGIGFLEALVSSNKTSQAAAQVISAVDSALKMPAPAARAILGVAGVGAAHFRALQNRIGPTIDLRYVAQERPQAPPGFLHVVVVGAAKRYWKTFEDPKVKYCEPSTLGEVTQYIKQLVPLSSIG